MKRSENVNEISKAMSSFQGQMKPALKDSANPFFKSRYSNLESVWEAIREPLCKNELTAVQDVFTTENGVSISTTLLHSSGQWMEFGPLEIPLSKKDAQSVGSATSYGKRYALCAACGVVSGDEDDDGEKAMNRHDAPSKFKKEKEEKKEEPVITPDQVKQIKELKEKCDPNYISTVLNHMASLGCNGFENLSVAMYPRVLKGMTENSSIYKKGK